MKTINFLSLIPIAVALVSCDVPEATTQAADVEATDAGYLSPQPEWAESDYTDWMSRAELQYLQDMSPAEQYFAYVEGRNNSGVAEFRAVRRDLPTDQYSQWAVFWGINEMELFDWELRLLRTGFERKSMQVFFDSTGNAVHQIVWLRPVGAIDNVPEEELAAIEVQPELPDSTEIVQQADTAPVLVPLQNPAPPVEAIVVEPVVEDSPIPVAQKIYVVVPGDNLGRIARRYKTTVSALKKKNGLKNDILRIGEKLRIP